MLTAQAEQQGAGYIRYLEQETVEEAYWQGRAAEMLGIEYSKVQGEQIDDLSQGRINRLYDFVVNPPKSLSVVSLLDERVLSAHRQATLLLMDRMERLAAAHRQYETYWTGNLLMAAYEHRLSRRITQEAVPDVHIHTHVVTVNMTNVEGEWVALRARPLFNERYQLTEFYREALAHRVTDLGYAVREKADQVGWEIGGMPQEAIDNFSRRHFQIADKLLEWQKRMDGVQPTRIDEQNIARQTRVKKDLSVSPEEMRERHIQRLSPAERHTLHGLAERAHEHSHKMRLRMEVAYGEEQGQNHRQLGYGERISL